MKVFALITSLSIMIITSCSAQNTTEPAGDESSLTVLSYNIHHSNPPTAGGLIDLESIAAVIMESEADIVGLQEVDIFTERSGKDLHMAKELAEMTGMDYFYFSKGIDFQGGEYGTAILSKFPLGEMETIPLPSPEGTEPRTLSLAKILHTSLGEIYFANTHLDYTSVENSLAQAKKITETLAPKQQPIVMVGDFNAEPSSETIQFLDEYYIRTCGNSCAPTIPVVNPTKAIDFIMYSKEMGISTQSHEVIPESYASDHLPVKAVLNFE